jgi:hypothetical protein
MINWIATEAEEKIIYSIAVRASEHATKHGERYPLLDASMDLSACHLNGNPLNLQGLLDANDADFDHDISGIRNNLNRINGQLQNCFVPRYSAHS